jgi:hypothetical protein
LAEAIGSARDVNFSQGGNSAPSGFSVVTAVTDIADPLSSTPDARLATLRGRIGRLCRALRFAIIAYVLWMLVAIALFWTDEQKVASHFLNALSVDVSGASASQRLGASCVSLVIWLVLAAACFSGWRLFSTYLRGRIFTPDAARWLRRFALFGLIAALVDIAARPIMSLILTAHEAAGRHIVSVYLRPEDLSTVLLLATLLALAHVQKTAADIADEHSQFV